MKSVTVPVNQINEIVVASETAALSVHDRITDVAAEKRELITELSVKPPATYVMDIVHLIVTPEFQTLLESISSVQEKHPLNGDTVFDIVSRSAGKIGGAWISAVLTRAESKIRRYLGIGILSQAGVAIGLALVVKQTLAPMGQWGAKIGALVITTITTTSIVFEIVGPILCKLGLQKAGEIPPQGLKPQGTKPSGS